ncbi:MAG TPA: SusC/RagA family TonB-linked outer membrane protein [Longimicrobium sp.]|nr:SusC/RagA family TonB-linked outer membrane protein [Longimicrobium sp.]
MGSRTHRWGRLLAAALALLCAAPALHAQGAGTVSGRVTSASGQRPLAGVQVAVVGTSRSTVTNQSGEYTLAAVPAGTVRVRAVTLGYAAGERAVTVTAGGTATADFALTESAVGLDALVVTGTPGAVERRTLGNAVTTVDVADLTTKASVVNVTEVLQSKTPGVQILPNSGTPGAAADIRIRGASSFITNMPVVYVDGVRYNTGSLGNFAPSGAGITGFSAQETSALNGINPNDIESIEVIKGPAAATLYGAEAAGGVIQIITKKGNRANQRPSWNFRVEAGETEWALDTPTNYTTCDAAKKADPALWPGCVDVPAGTVITDNPLRRDPDALRTGGIQRYGVSLSGGADRYSYYVAGDLDREEGVFLNSFSNRRSVRGNFSLNPVSALDLQLNTSYYRSQLRLPYGDESANGLLLSAARGRPGRFTTNPRSAGWAAVNPEQSNRYNNQTWTDRFTLGATANHRPFEWFRHRLTVGMDYTNSLAQVIAEPLDADVPQGVSAQRVPRTHVYTVDYAGNFIASLSDALQSTTSFGLQWNKRDAELLSASGTGLGAPDVTVIGSATTIAATNAFGERTSVGVFGQQEFALHNRLFVTAALRGDDHSAFGENYDWLIYPKLSMSYVLSEEPALERFVDAARLDELRVRAAWGRAGRAPEDYTAIQTYTVDKVTLGAGTASALRTASIGNPDLRAEKGSEIEVGFDAGWLNGRVGAEFTYYSKKMEDAILALAVPGSLGFPGSRLFNIGETSNSGLELGLNVTPVQSRLVTWNSRLSLSTNRNRLESFGDPSLTTISPTGQAYGVVQQHREGYPIAGYWAQLPLRNEDGTPRLSPAGAVLLDTATYIGPSAPTREIGFSNELNILGNLRLYALVDYKGGHYLFNLKERNRCQAANSNCQRVNDPRVTSPQTAADSLLAKELPVWQNVPGEFIEPADFFKLRELSLTWSVPQRLIRRTGAGTASLTVAGRNLALWSDYSGLDPEVNTYGNRSFVRADAYAAPMNRRVTVSVNLTY